MVGIHNTCPCSKSILQNFEKEVALTKTQLDGGCLGVCVHGNCPSQSQSLGMEMVAFDPRYAQ